ncbi:MAG: saccharopine dehydrogenase NADP-binding domain-containing protein [Polyangiales bacterium]
MNEREFDVIVFGATGFTGRLVAEYFAEIAGEQRLRWAIAGRDRAKLERVREALGAEVSVLVGDAMDEAAMRAMARRTRVVLSTVGPFARYGSALVGACVAEATDYCDTTGEVQWVRAMIDAHHERAKASGARIVHCCGYDSVPSDLGTLALFDHVEKTRGVKLARIDHYAGEVRGGVSGGTIASMVNVMEEASHDRALRKLLLDPYSLNPAPRPTGPDVNDAIRVRFDSRLQLWTAPWVMAAINSRVVRRSNAMMGYRYGQGFRYAEAMSTGAGVKGLARAAGATAAMAGALVALQPAKLRELLKERVLPKPGEGPSRESIERGFFVSRFVGEAPGVDARLIIRGQRDPGYGATARMIAESALALLQGERVSEGGVLTPASAIGLQLVSRLERVGIRFEFE